MKKNYAFTGIEILLVVAIIAILAAVVVPRVGRGGLFDRLKVYSVAHRIASDVRLARRLAVTERKTYRIKFSKAGGSSDYNEYKIQKKNGSWAVVGETKSIPDEIIVRGGKKATFGTDGTASKNRTFKYKIGSYRYRVKVSKNTGRVLLEAY